MLALSSMTATRAILSDSGRSYILEISAQLLQWVTDAS